jgi:PAS domain S-box-containing protein
MPDWGIARDRSELRASARIALVCTATAGLAALVWGSSDVPTLWPLLGIGGAALALAGLRHWPAVALAASLRFAAAPLVGSPAPAPPCFALAGFAFLLTAAAVAVAALLRRAPAPPLSTLPGVLAFVVGGCVLVCFALGLLAAGVAVAARPDLAVDPVSLALRSWGAASTSLLIAGGAVLAYGHADPDPPAGGGLEQAGWFAALALVGVMLFHTGPWQERISGLPHLRAAAVLLPAPLMIWAGVRFGPRRCSAGLALIAVLALTGGERLLTRPLSSAPGGALTLFYALAWSMALAGFCAAAIARRARAASAQLQASHGELERRIASRTAELGLLNAKLEREVERRRAIEASLRDSQARLERAQRIARLGDWEWRVGSDRVRYSDEVFRILGLDPTPDSHLQRSDLSIPDAEERSATLAAFRDAIQRRARYETAFRVRGADGRLVQLEVHGDAMLAPDGSFLGMAGTAQDVTERHQLEERLRQGQKLEAIGRLAGGIAHDFNNLLTPINGFAELLLDQLGDTPLGRDAAEIQRAGERAAALTRQLLAFSRRQAAEPRSIDLNRVLDGMLALLAHALGEQIELCAELAAEPVPVRADPHQLEQMILNLAVNARDAMPRGGRLTIATRSAMRRDGAGARSFGVLAVEDSGAGIDSDTREHPFEPFFATQEIGRGTGLGLATVYGIAEEAGARIEFERRAGGGTRFEVWLASPLEVPDRDAPPRPIVERRGGAETILVAEDEPNVRGYVRRVLEERGYRVLESADAQEALERARAYPGQIDLLITDMVMPGKSGIDLSLELRAECPELPVLFMTGYADSVLGEHLAGQAAAVLCKPFSPASLADNVRRMLDARG